MMFQSRVIHAQPGYGTRWGPFGKIPSLPSDLRSWRITFGNLIGAMRWLERFVWNDRPLDEMAIRGLNYNLPLCRRSLDAVDINTIRRAIPEVVNFEGGHWQSWHEALIGIAERQRYFLAGFLPPGHDDEITSEQADKNIKAVVCAATSDGWPWKQPIDCDKLWTMIEWEITQLPDDWPQLDADPPKLRNDVPTDAEIALAREVLDGMTAKNPSVRAFREAARAKGLKAGNAKLGIIFKQLTGK